MNYVYESDPSASENPHAGVLIEVGQRWTFVHSCGDRTSYVVEFTEDRQSPESIVHLLNPATNKLAMVTHHWLHQPPSRYSHWIFEAGAPVSA